MTKRLCLSIVLFVSLLSLFFSTTVPAGGFDTDLNRKKPSLAQAFGQLPLYFVENRGQWDERVHFHVQGQKADVFFTSQGLTFRLSGPAEEGQITPASTNPGPRKAWVIKLDFVGANGNVEPAGQGKTPAVISYFKGAREDWKAGLPTYASVAYQNLWPGIDLVYTGTGGRLKYTFLVRPGADPGRIRLAYRGASSVTVTDSGALSVETPLGGFEDEAPCSYQELETGKTKTPTSYVIEDDGPAVVYGFKVGDYDPGEPLFIDPGVLLYCGYIGGSQEDRGQGIAVDGSGNAYVTGYTYSTVAQGFPAAVGPEVNHNGSNDAFVAKVNALGTALDYCGYIGGSQNEEGYGIAVDGSGNAYVTGYTGSTAVQGFPAAVGPEVNHNGGNDAFVARVNASGTTLDYCGYIGGSQADFGQGIAVDGSGNAYVTGYTYSTLAQGFPAAVGPEVNHNGTTDAFVAKVNASGTALDYCGFIGGSQTDYGRGIAVDGSGNAYVTGDTWSTAAQGFPAAVGPEVNHNGGG